MNIFNQRLQQDTKYLNTFTCYIWITTGFSVEFVHLQRWDENRMGSGEISNDATLTCVKIKP